MHLVHGAIDSQFPSAIMKKAALKRHPMHIRHVVRRVYVSVVVVLYL
jgi:hypothetical protein